MNLYSKVEQEIKKGLDGENNGITIGFPFLDNYISLRKRMYTLIFAGSGIGKSSFASEAYILNPIDWYLKNKHNTKTKLKIHYFSMERSSVYTVCKWVSRKIFLDHGISIPVSQMLGWGGKRLTPLYHDYVKSYKDYLGELEEIVEIYDGACNPTGIFKNIREFGALNGKIEDVSEHKKIYIPNDDNLVTEYIIDHQSRIKTEKGMTSKKEAIDVTSGYLQMARDFYGFSPLMIAQTGRQLGNIMYSNKSESFEPTPEQIMDSSIPYFDSDVCMSLFDPLYYNTGAPSGHDALRLKNNETGAKYYRSLKIHKNTWGEADLRKGLAFHGMVGTFKELKKASDMTEQDYQAILNNTYFLK